jgi:uncharacterized membrane protein YcaP (DUF421 family)
MTELLELSVPWWEIVLRGSAVYLLLMLLLRLSGKRTVGQFTPFDLMVLVLLGDAVQGSMLGGDQSLPGGLLLAVTLLGWNRVVGYATAHSERVERIVEGRPDVLARNGEVDHAALRAANKTLHALPAPRRQNDCAAFSDVRLAVLEKDGRITILRQKKGDGGN